MYFLLDSDVMGCTSSACINSWVLTPMLARLLPSESPGFYRLQPGDISLGMKLPTRHLGITWLTEDPCKKKTDRLTVSCSSCREHEV